MRNILLIILLSLNIITQSSYEYDFMDNPNYIEYNDQGNISKKLLENNFYNDKSYRKIDGVNFDDKKDNINHFSHNKIENKNNYQNIDFKSIKNKTEEILKKRANILYLKNIKNKLDNEIKINENQIFLKVQKKVINELIEDVGNINNRFSIIEKTLSLLVKN